MSFAFLLTSVTIFAVQVPQIPAIAGKFSLWRQITPNRVTSRQALDGCGLQPTLGLMKLVVCAITLIGTFSTMASAQEPSRSRYEGYLFAGPGIGNIGPGEGSVGDVHFGFGGERFFYKGLSLGAEIGAVGPVSAGPPDPGFSDWVVGLGSTNAAYHFLAPNGRGVEPFLTGGYSLFFRAGLSHGYNVGGGSDFWMKRNLGLRFEVRDQQSSNRDVVSFRVGVVFR
jgi:hypothetical protein